MPRMTLAEYQAYTLRRNPIVRAHVNGCDSESELHQQILDYCASQWPKWKVIHARMDLPSTIPIGAHDLTIFLPNRQVLCVECKTRTGKQTIEQSGWEMEMLKLGHPVHLVRSFEDFMSALQTTLTTNDNNPRSKGTGTARTSQRSGETTGAGEAKADDQDAVENDGPDLSRPDQPGNTSQGSLPAEGREREVRHPQPSPENTGSSISQG